MIAGLIFVLSMTALLQLFVSYCRSLVAVYSEVELSPQVRELTGLQDRVAQADEFYRLIRLVQLCPKRGDDRVEMRAVRAYYGLLGLLQVAFPMARAVVTWVNGERTGCAYFAAVALDRRMGYHSDAIS